MAPTACPACGSGGHYTLKDGRVQCTSCRRKYTVKNHRVRLSEEALRMVARSFWRMVPAMSAATEQGVNSKTLQKYYDLIRRAIADGNEAEAAVKFGAARVAPELFRELAANSGLPKEAQPLFCLAQAAGKSSLLFAAEGPDARLAGVEPPDIAGWVYARDPATFHSLDLDHMHFAPGPATAAGSGRSFWIYAKKGLVKYHGGFRKNFPLFVHEMDFRFKADKEDAALNRLMEILLAI